MLLIFLLPSILSGCFGEDLQNIADDSSDEIYPEPWNRSDREYDNSDVFSRVTENGTYDIGPVQSVFVAVPSITPLMEAQVPLAVQKFILVSGCQLSKDAIIHQLKI